MTTVRAMREPELKVIATMEEQPHAREFVLPTSIEQHRKNFSDPNLIYLSIETTEQQLAGYFMLYQEEGAATVEFRRIVVDQHHRGVGQDAIAQMEDYSRDVLSATRIWLDVFDDNAKGIHIYEKLGYQFDRVEDYQGRALRFYSKAL